jgi:hypothetical protein
MDKPRQYSFTVHGVAWPEHRFQQDGGERAGDGLLRVGHQLRHGAHAGVHAGAPGRPRLPQRRAEMGGPQGMWGILRVEDAEAGTATEETSSDTHEAA